MPIYCVALIPCHYGVLSCTPSTLRSRLSLEITGEAENVTRFRSPAQGLLLRRTGTPRDFGRLVSERF
jgi:hypothetical protein